ncbi:MAG TPA: DMT family transporter [Longimicrobium sp.]|nr:DMT family transporter [Longimicrobium sp.]
MTRDNLARRLDAPAPALHEVRPAPAPRGDMARVYTALLLVQLFFGALPIAVKLAVRELTSPALALIRVTLAALLFHALHRALVRERIRDRRDYWALALYAVFGVMLNQILYITALTLTTATAAQTLVAAGPAITLLVALVLRRETATRLKWLGIGIAAIGAVWLVGVGARTGNALGNLLALLNVAAYSIYLVISRGLLRKYDALTVITWVFTFGALGMVPWGIVPLARQIGQVSAQGWASIAFIVLLPTVGAYWLNVFALKRVESSIVSVFVYLQPVVTAMIAIPVLHEHVSPRLIPAAVLIFAGVSLTVWEGRRERLRRGGRPSPAEQEMVEA